MIENIKIEKKCVLITAYCHGNIKELANLKEEDYLICVDGGYVLAQNAGLSPNLIVGDFDSAPLPNNLSCEIIELPKDKDDTDTIFALRQALNKGFININILGGLGGRADHGIGLLQTLAFGKDLGGNLRLIDGQNTLFIIENQEVTIPKETGKNLSLLCFSDTCTNINATGTKYIIKNKSLTSSYPLGLSNTIVENEAKISVGTGKLIVVISKD